MSGLDELGGWPALLTELLDKHDLPAAHARAAMATILAGEATAAQLIGFVVALRAKGETPEELSGLLDAVLAAATLVPLPPDLQARAVDIVGTGGDRSHSINVSTMAAIVTAGAGVPVCKHGARASSSQCGTADVLEALGVAIELGPEGVLRCVEDVGIGFCLAPRYHPAFRFAAPSRREIGIPTVFNLLGPMANPGRVKRQLIGVANPGMAERMLASLRLHGSHRAWVVHGSGLDELTTTGPSTVLALDDDSVHTFTVNSLDLGLAPAILDELVGGTPDVNAQVVRDVLAGNHGAHRNIVVLNAAAALIVAGVAETMEEGLARAIESIDSGSAAATLARWVAVSQQAAEELGH
ncbi:MAG: anthranilate phosphoribosyltransferase [Actinobacteria bacterium]|uniref:anthranilate phosphoribosyltransferase n=1 Tax=freshwater metagenome TaxID=449393 RepID=A0A6J7C9Z4_9ZZZZ|nr:anthranilate phosphoribosyltransferase [Actinomycetota bacterium]MSW78695.1 anthranilate phosphoribosyltransferase [Actinomycetota bacterium]MSX55928.1 anthranilate phosphoribosyltransferase [Actinomycetota bacterium]MSX94892.1 anthranilate phosphoribosyltransferase [Actinomycetota bacterium]MSZ83735.1 anthranilate phosphoribosyltransferase [Actinomycetota bacterium]